jgi:hypothetical protein
MLLILIPVAWLAITTLVLAVCVMAARGDADIAPIVAETVREPIVDARLRRTPRRPPYGGLRARGARRRGARSAAGS